MLIVVTLLVLQMCSSAFGAHSCHHNHHGLTEADVIDMVMADMDHDEDGYISVEEFTKEFVLRFDHNGDNRVSEDEFVKQWHSTYHDSKEFSARVFLFLGIDHGTELAISNIPRVLAIHDTNGDGRLDYAEFKAALLKVYTDCP